MKFFNSTTLINVTVLLCSMFFFYSCSSDDNSSPSGIVNPPIILDCNYFDENDEIHLTDDPDAPVDYVIVCYANIGNKDITVDPGVVIEFEQDAGIKMGEKSKISFNGTKEKPILLTGAEKIEGYWTGIASFSTYSNNTMTYTTIEYGGGRAVPSWPDGLQGNLCIWKGNSTFNIENSVFRKSAAYGLWSDAELEIHSNTFTQNKWPIRVYFINVDMINGSNQYEGNTNDYVHVLGGGGGLIGNIFSEIDVPYLVEASDIYGRIKINEGALVIEPGVELVMKQVANRDLQRFVIESAASIKMIGTAEKPIIIRGWEEMPGSWNSIEVNSQDLTNEISYVKLYNAGDPTNHPNGAVWLRSSSTLNIQNVSFIDCFDFAVSIQNLNNSNFTYNNLSLENTPRMFSNFEGNEIVNP